MSKQRITLPQPQITGSVSVEAAIAQRRSVRRYTSKSLKLEQIGQLLWSAQGVTGRMEKLRAAPSAGACHPLVFYVCRKDGIWRYHPENHSLTHHVEQDVCEALVQASWDQKFIAEATCVFVISAIMEHTTKRYGERGKRRYVPMDIGHAAQNVLLQAVALGLAAVPIGAFTDAAVSEVLALPKPEVPMYLIPVGYPR
ncbi:MAG: SagB/ThcOx family dehydrogenase [Anaerolineae bacterium]